MDEHSNRDKRAAIPPGHTKLPPLTPAFISADDAARYVHERIGTTRDIEYGSVIMQRLSDQLYVATEPALGQAKNFDLNLILERERGSTFQFVEPQGYKLVGALHSHPDDFAGTQRANPTWSPQQVKAFMGFFSTDDIIVNYRVGVQLPLAYLSGPNGELLRYQTRFSNAEDQRVGWLRGEGGWTSVYDAEGTEEGAYKALASVGSIRFVLSNAAWGGSVGDVPGDWEPYKPFKAPPMQLNCGPVFPSRDQVLNHAATRIKRQPENRLHVLILQGAVQGRYVTCEPQLVELSGWPSGGLLSRLPPGFHVEGVYFHAQPSPSQYPTVESWLYQNFISPLELATHIAQFRRYSPQPRAGTTLYIRMRDQALLRYRFSGSALESQLFAQAPGGPVTDNGQQAALMAGTLTPHDFVLQVAAAGQLSVIDTSRLWDQVGEVGPQWRPFSKIPQPTLGPPFITADDAARWAHEWINLLEADKEYGGAILKKDSRYFATTPIAGEQLTFDHRIMLATDADDNFIAPGGYTCEALYHSHPAHVEQVKLSNPGISDDHAWMMISFFSPADLSFIIEHRGSVPAHYLCGPEGSLLKYVSSGSATEVLLRKRILGEAPFPASEHRESLIWMAAEAGDLRVVVPNARWGGVRGRVKQGWKVNAAVTQVTEEQPFFTPVFERVELAILAALALPTSEQAFGFVLKHIQSDSYVATYPEPPGPLRFAPAGLFPERSPGKLRLPSNFRLEAIYCRSTSATADAPAHESWLQPLFFSPAQITDAITQARATLELQDKTRGLALYLLAEDDAVLRFKLPDAQTVTELVNETVPGVLDDNGAQAAMRAGTLTPRHYVRRVLAAGDLSVVVSGQVWRRSGRVDSRSPLLAPVHRAVLSPAFLSATDAAVYAHEKIGERRDRAYGGYILKGEDGRFIVTEPMEAGTNPFAAALFFPADDLNPLIPPEPYMIHGRYGSHPALSMVEPRWVAQRRWTREEAEINLQAFTVEEIRAVIQQQRPAYLSGSEDCLLAYTPSASSQEALLLNGTAPQTGGSLAQMRLDSGLMKPAQWVVILAEAGDLRIVQGNPLWGPRSPVYADWTPNFAYAPRFGPPDYATYGAVFSSADEAARDLHARVHGRNLAEQAYFGFILKHKDKAHYLASEVVGVNERVKLFNLNSVFAATEDNSYRFPDGFVLCGLFRSQQWQPVGLPASSTWLTRYFVMPMVLYGALVDSKHRGAKYNNGNNLPIYFSTEEGALLRYLPLPFNVGSGGLVDHAFEEIEVALASGKKTPQEFVRDWANAGELSVVRTSQCWDKLGLVPRTWSGYENLSRRHVGPAFANPDDAARYAAAIVGEGRHRTYGGVLLRLPGGGFAATDPLVVPPQGFALNWIYPDAAIAQGLYPPGSTIVARYRSVVRQETQILLSVTQKAVYQSMLPTHVLSNLLRREVHVKREYLFGPEGLILRYQLSGSAEEEELKQQLAPLNLARGDAADNEIERQLRAGTLLPVDFVTQVAKAGDLQVVKGDALWGFARPLSGPFVPYVTRAPALEIKQVFADAPCSPIFTQACDAVRYAQRLSSPQAQVQFGYVLKSVKRNAYMTTVPLVRADYSDFKQVFVEGQLPQGYALDGLYLCASTVAIAPASDEMATCFFSPASLAMGVNFVSNMAKNGVLPLYLLCADGALLRYLFRKNGAQSLHALNSEMKTIEPKLLDGSLTVAYYVRGLAARGELYVRVRSTVWAREEAVTAQWRPKLTPWDFADNPHLLSFCGPLFSHADDAARWTEKQLGGFMGQEYLGAVLVPPSIPGFVGLDPVLDQRTFWESTVSSVFLFRGIGLDVTSVHPLFLYTLNAVHAFYKVAPRVGNPMSLDLQLLGNFASKDDLRSYITIVKNNRPVAESLYLSCRGGALLKYVPGFTAGETLLLSVDSSPLPTVLVSGLREAGKLSVLETDSFWTRRGTLGAEWQVKDVQAAPDPQVVQYGRDKDEL